MLVTNLLQLLILNISFSHIIICENEWVERCNLNYSG